MIPSTSLNLLATAESKLAQYEEFVRTSAAFLATSAKEPAYERLESSLMIAFEGWPKVVVSDGSPKWQTRILVENV